ncbi:MAG: histone deacetylase [Chthoniobacterales bacterium]
MVLVFDSRATGYGQEYHPERPARLIRGERHLREGHPDWRWVKPEPAGDGDVLSVHSQEHLVRLRRPVDFDTDTPYYEGIEDHARRAAGAAIEVVNRALVGEKSFALMRPPGHHAMRDRAMGFCYLNSMAIAAFSSLKQGCERVAIWDFDAHHGNGTEAVVHHHARLRFASIHQYPGYPGSGKKSFDNIFNWPIAPRSDPAFHCAKVKEALERLLEFKPDLLLVSAGFDAFAGDPITEMTLEREHFAEFGRWLKEAGIPSGAILEGGYSGELPLLIDAFLTAWEG